MKKSFKFKEIPNTLEFWPESDDLSILSSCLKDYSSLIKKLAASPKYWHYT